MPPRTQKTRSLAEIMRNGPRGGLRRHRTDVSVNDLPMDVLKFILSDLHRRDNIRASAVCKRWLAAAVSTRRVSTPPWLIAFPKYSNSYEFYDPSDRRTRPFVLPQIQGSRFIYASSTWLLLEKTFGLKLFMFCPYSREKVVLPKLRLSFEIAAFSGAPTSPNCIVFALSYQRLKNSISICTCQPGATKWVISCHDIQTQFPLGKWRQAVFFNGCVYCLSLLGQVGVFDIGSRTWRLLQNTPAKLLEENPTPETRWKAKFMAEHDGSLYIVCVCASRNPCVYRVHHTESEIWEEVKSLGNVTLFANCFSSQARVDLDPDMSGKLIFSKHITHGIIEYPPDQVVRPIDRLYQRYRKESKNRIWIEAPGN